MTNPSDARAFVDQWAAITRRVVANSGVVVAETAEQIGAGTFTGQTWVKSATQIFDIALLGSLELAEATLIGPAKFAPESVRSQAITVDADTAVDRVLTVTTPFVRLGESEAIHGDRLTFDPPAGRDANRNPVGVLAVGATEFHIAVKVDELPSGIYAGAVCVTNPRDLQASTIPVMLAL